MEDILSQNEIDAIIAAAANKVRLEPERAGERIVTYDFRRPNRFSKEELRALRRLHDSFARELSSKLSARLRSRIELSVLPLEQITFGEFIRSLPSPSMISLFYVSEHKGYLIIQLAPDIAFLLYDRMCGGAGTPIFSARELTDIELAVMRTQFLTAVISSMESAWRDTGSLSFDFLRFESNPEYLQVMGERDPVLLIPCLLRVNDTEDMMAICLPHSLLEPVLPQLVRGRASGGGSGRHPEIQAFLEQKMAGVEIPLEVELGSVAATVADVLELGEGEIIPFSVKPGDDLEVRIGPHVKFMGRPGRINDRLAVTITKVCSRGGE